MGDLPTRTVVFMDTLLLSSHTSNFRYLKVDNVVDIMCMVKGCGNIEKRNLSRDFLGYSMLAPFESIGRHMIITKLILTVAERIINHFRGQPVIQTLHCHFNNKKLANLPRPPGHVSNSSGGAAWPPGYGSPLLAAVRQRSLLKYHFRKY